MKTKEGKVRVGHAPKPTIIVEFEGKMNTSMRGLVVSCEIDYFPSYRPKHNSLLFLTSESLRYDFEKATRLVLTIGGSMSWETDHCYVNEAKGTPTTQTAASH